MLSVGRSARGFLAVAAVSLICGVADAPAAERRDLAGTTTITGSASGYVPVRLPAPVLVATEDNSQQARQPEEAVKFSVEGEGRLVGVLVLPDPPKPNPLVLVARATERLFCPQPCGRRQGPTMVWPAGGEADGGGLLSPDMELGEPAEVIPIRLPAGDYRIYLLTGGSPVRAQMVIPGLAGVADLSPTVPTAFDAEELLSDDLVLHERGLSGRLGPVTLATRGRQLLVSQDSVEGGQDGRPGGLLEWCHWKTGSAPADGFDRGCSQRQLRGQSQPFIADFTASPPVATEPRTSSFFAFYGQKLDPLPSMDVGGTLELLGGIKALSKVEAVIGIDAIGAPAAGHPTPPVRASPAAAALPTLMRGTLRARGRTARVPLRCGATRCRATVSLGAGRVPVQMRAGTKRTLRVGLPRSARRRLAAGRRLRVTVTIANENSRFQTAVTVTPPR